MTKLHLLLFSGLALLVSCGDKNQETAKDHLFDIAIINGGEDTLLNYGIELDLVRVEEDFHLMVNDQHVPVQIEDRNKNERPDKMFAMIDLLPRSSLNVRAFPGSGPQIAPGVKLHANLSDGEAVTGSHLLNFEEKWAANGIIIENDWIGYRAMMIPPYAIDIIGKRKSEMLDSPVNIDLERISDWGGDALDEALSLGIGSPAVYDLEKIVPLSKFDTKEIEIVESGPLRAEVHMTVKGVPVRNDKVDFLINWQMEPAKHWAQIEVSIISKTDLNLQFAIGLPKHEEATDFTQGLLNEVHFAYTYGLQSSEGEPLGMAIMVPGPYELDTYRDDPHNHFYLITPIKQAVQYRMVSAWSKGKLAIYDEVMFLDLLRKYTAEYGAKVTVKPDFGL